MLTQYPPSRMARASTRRRMAVERTGGRMADDDKTPPEPKDEPKETPEPKKETGDDSIDWKAMARKHERDAKAHAAKLKELEDRDKSETEKLTERNRELEGNLTSTQLTALRYEIALDKGIPKAIANRLQGETREEMEADADELLKTLGTPKKQPSFDGGAKDDGHEGGGSFLAQALRNKRSG